MKLGFKRSVGRSDQYWFTGPQEGSRKYIRVIAGVALPVFDRLKGAVVVVGETYRPSGLADFIALGCSVGEWASVENALAQLRQDLKFDHVIVDKEEARSTIWRMKALRYGMSEIPLMSYAAPPYTAGEIGRVRVDELAKEGRLTIPLEIRRAMEMEPQMGALALRCAVCWMHDIKAIYLPLQDRRGAVGRPLGLEGL